MQSDKVSFEMTNDSVYPEFAPFDPSTKYNEYTSQNISKNKNEVYDIVRNLLINLSLDKENIGSEKWSPFSKLVKKNGTVFIKPNLAKHIHKYGNSGLKSTITHGSVIRPLIDYAFKAVGTNGKIVIGDTPFEHTLWEPMMNITGIDEMVKILKNRGIPIFLYDLRKYQTIFKPGMRNTIKIEKNGDPLGYSIIDLKEESEFSNLDKFEQNYHTLADHTVDHYDPYKKNNIGVTNKYHNKNTHQYLVSNSILSADLIINVPKLKTHGKTGVTLNLKNMIGIVSGKEYMPHHRPGKPPFGDSFPIEPNKTFINNRLRRRDIAEKFSWIQKLFPKKISDIIINTSRKIILENFYPVKDYMDDRIEWGDWHGNDTLWRTIIDLNKILLYWDLKENKFSKKKLRNYFSVIDGILGQEGQGPTAGDPFESKVLLAGTNPVSVDTIACIIMGIDPDKIKLMKNSNLIKNYIGTTNLDKINVFSKDNFPFYEFKAPGNSKRAWEENFRLEKFDSKKIKLTKTK